ncbi:hydrogenase maturation protease [Acidihalobacter prosperus]|uniref:Hydrogenase maturation protease n=1 Tax=Acidihalobacter prosperus TaxID=160660 RepID=A0A1A6C2Q8_9GAMM|nr:hydrogenase maturation protease [Acidihalobacter prosperus]OBS08830.1 Hydrogenase maturation protease [Acidihalobacter prosperus]
MTRLAILGIGSPFGGDRIAWILVERLRRSRFAPAHDVIVETLDRPGPALLERLQCVERAILVDAVAGGCEPAAWYAEDTFARFASPLSGHAIGLAETLDLGRALGDLPALELLGLRLRADGTADPHACTAGLRLLIRRLRSLSR